MLSIAINVKNGERYLAKCLDALTAFDDVVILDNFSTDQTQAIAIRYTNVRFFQHEFCGMGKLRNILATYAKYDWIFCVDSDEIVSKKLVDVLLQLPLDPQYVYSFMRQNYYANLHINTSSWGNDSVIRLYNRNITAFDTNSVHEHLIMKHTKIKLLSAGVIYHFPYEQVSQLINKLQFYSTLYAQQNLGQKKLRTYSLPLRAVLVFLKCYILKRGWTQGIQGLIISSYNAMGVFSKYIKLYELSSAQKIGLAICVNDKSVVPIISLINQQRHLPDHVWVILPSNVSVADMHNITQQFQQQLIITYSIIMSHATTASVIPPPLYDTHEVDCIVYLPKFEKINNPNFFYKYRKYIVGQHLKGRPLPHVLCVNN